MSNPDKVDNPNLKFPFWKTRKIFAGAKQLLFARADEMSSKPTIAEELLGHYLRAKPWGFKFRRPHPYGNYIL